MVLRPIPQMYYKPLFVAPENHKPDEALLSWLRRY
jgi:hypothetical protein